MTFVGVTITINESGIIEAFVRYNLRYLDRLIIVDNGSSDNTLLILNRLVDEGLPITIREVNEQHLQPRKRQDQELRELTKLPNVTHAFPLDSDELLLVPSREALEQDLQAIPPDHSALAPWVTYCPTEKDDWDEPDPVRRITHRRKQEIEQYYKVIVSSAHFAEGRFTAGKHHLLGRTGKLVRTVTFKNIRIAHFPVRLESQILTKILIGSWNLQLNTKRKKGGGYHWLKYYEQFRRDLKLTRAQLEKIATSYASPKPVSLVEDPLPVPEEPVLRYADLIDQDLTRRLIGFTDQLVKLHVSKKTNPAVTSKAVAVNFVSGRAVRDDRSAFDIENIRFDETLGALHHAAFTRLTLILRSRPRDWARSKASCMPSQVSGVEPKAIESR